MCEHVLCHNAPFKHFETSDIGTFFLTLVINKRILKILQFSCFGACFKLLNKMHKLRQNVYILCHNLILRCYCKQFYCSFSPYFKALLVLRKLVFFANPPCIRTLKSDKDFIGLASGLGSPFQRMT